MKKKDNIIKILRFSLIILISGLLFTNQSCKKHNDTCELTCDINQFIWKGMNTYYLWQDSIPALADNRFHSQEELENFVNMYPDPEFFFENLLWKRGEVDRWSWIVDDYEELEAYFQGVRKTSGAKFKLYLTAENSSDVFGVVRYVLPGSDAEEKGIHRGDLFASVNGVQLTTSNYRQLLFDAGSFTLDLGDYQYDTGNQSVNIIPNGQHVELINTEYNENPVFIKTVFNTTAGKIGYLMYNSFTSNYDHDLNEAFAYFQTEGISDLILDLRYNGGGSVRTAIYLAGMISGQWNGEIFSREIWNSKMNQWLQENHPEWAVNYFTGEMQDGTTINSLHLNRLYVITTGDSASASELVINALRPYMPVYTIGTTTHGKYAASVTLYDSPDFTKNNVNPEHHWAMQPIVLKEVNATGDYAPEGFAPDETIIENITQMGELGDENEPLLQASLNYITNGTGKSPDQMKFFPYHYTENALEKEMFVEFLNK